MVRDRQPPDPSTRDGGRADRSTGPSSSRPNKPSKANKSHKPTGAAAAARAGGDDRRRPAKGAKGRPDKRASQPAGKPTKNMGFRGPLEQPPPPTSVAKPEQREPIRRVIEEVATRADLDLVELEIKQAGTDWRISVSLDRQAGRGGITLDECARASRQIAEGLDAIAGLAEIYELEVGSPGMNRRLRGWSDLQRYLGLTIKATIAPPQRESVIGVLIGVEGDAADPLLTLRTGKAQPKKGITGKVQLQWGDLESALLWPTLPEWRDLGLKLAQEAQAAGLPYAGGEDHDLAGDAGGGDAQDDRDADQDEFADDDFALDEDDDDDTGDGYEADDDDTADDFDDDDA